ncbi:MAG: M20/M25/M40 family metallo-hydrolase [Chloroflexi bacterium]|nr:M20/M25/M40 family metallo-hydrolase [Chloroflexota bacterium]
MFAEAHIAADRRLQEFIGRLKALASIPSISTDPAHWPDVERAAAWLSDWMHDIGMQNVRTFTRGEYLPLVYGDHLGAGPDAPTVLIYTHYDVQPAAREDGWDTEPFEPEIIDGKLYARGAVDSKIHVIAQLSAIACMIGAGSPPVNVKVLFEGEEESGSEHIFAFVAENPDLLKADVTVITDGSMPDPDQPVLVYGLRGLVTGEIRVKGPRRDLHSGHYGGTVHNPAQALAEIVAQLHTPDGKVTVPGFYDAVAPLSPDERVALSGIAEAIVDEWHQNASAPQPWGEEGFAIHERISARPTLEINGISGGYTGSGFKTVLPSTAFARFSCRLVPNQDPNTIFAAVKAHVMSLVPASVTVEVVELEEGSPGFVVDRHSAPMQAVRTAYQRAWSAEPLWNRDGGSVPVVTAFQRHLDTTIVLMPFGHKLGGAHSQNEHIMLRSFKRGIHAMLYFYEALTSLDAPGDA